MNSNWQPFDAPLDQILQRYPQPLQTLANRQVPALVVRNAYKTEHCVGLMQRFAQRGYFDRDTVGVESQLSGGPYLDLGTSLGRVGGDPEAFFAHAERTHALFAHLFDGFDNPVEMMYAALATLAPNKAVRTAYEPDGRRSHFDSAARRSQSDYAVANFAHQFAGVLCLQSAEPEGEPFIYDCYSSHEINQIVQAGEFEAHARAQIIAHAQVLLEPGDLYFFFSENIHEVPSVVGDRPRAVLAIFFATSPDDDEIFVWC